MSKLYFQDPPGDNFGFVTIEELKTYIFNKGDDFWNVGSGQAGLSCFESDDKKKASLYIKSVEKYGFLVDYRNYSEDTDIYSLKSGEKTGETVEAVIGGEPNLYYRNYFVPKEKAWKAIRYFAETGDRDPDSDWDIAEMPEQDF